MVKGPRLHLQVVAVSASCFLWLIFVFFFLVFFSLVVKVGSWVGIVAPLLISHVRVTKEKYLASLSLSFLICEMRMVIRIKCSNT